MKAVTGGTIWNSIGQTTAAGSVTMSGLSGTARLTSDLRRGRYAQNFRVKIMGDSGTGYDGTRTWSQDISGGVHAIDAPFSKSRAVTQAFLTHHGYFDSSGVRAQCAGSGVLDGRPITQVRVSPPGGIPATLSIDSTTSLLAGITERLPTTTEVTRYSDYRSIDGLTLPFEIANGTLAQPANGYDVHVTRYVLRGQPNAGDFEAPPMQHPARMRGGATKTTVPLALEGRQLLVWASIDGHTPMPFILDTGGHAILTTGAAKTLGLHPQGAGVSGGSGSGTVGVRYGRVSTLRIGDAELRDQRFLVIDYPYSFYERGRRQPLAGILGLEIFERFATRIDYGRLRLTLTPLDRYVAAKNAGAVPIVFQEDMPLAQAAADGHGGLFGVDTGNSGTVILFGSFLQATGLERAYSAGTRAVGHGTGGTNTGRIVTLRRFAFGGRSFSGILSFLSHMSSGSFSSWTEAGNFGYAILSYFVPTFDYARGVVYLEKSPYAVGPSPNRAGFVADKNDPKSFEVFRVLAGSPAARAGIAVGDSILSVDGRPAEEFSYGDLYNLATSKAGTRLRLTVVHQGRRRDVTLVLE